MRDKSRRYQRFPGRSGAIYRAKKRRPRDAFSVLTFSLL
ncbi:hypothetical protein L579_0933 [Pantoea sp. AS-PWVM4]|nr:hypothetical protein L579_0933 [Pantoea sp. AS-PWVM4]